MIPDYIRPLAIGLFVAVLTYVLLRITAREKRNFTGDFIIGLGALNWVFVVVSIVLSGFLSTMLIKSGFEGPAKDAWIFWGIYLFSVIAALAAVAAIVWTLLFPITIRDDTIYFVNMKLKRQTKLISQIEHAQEDKHGVVRFEFDDGEKLALHRYLGGAEAALQHIYERLMQQLADEFPEEERTIN